MINWKNINDMWLIWIYKKLLEKLK
jgi:hypothetical protein